MLNTENKNKKSGQQAACWNEKDHSNWRHPEHIWMWFLGPNCITNCHFINYVTTGQHNLQFRSKKWFKLCWRSFDTCKSQQRSVITQKTLCMLSTIDITCLTKDILTLIFTYCASMPWTLSLSYMHRSLCANNLRYLWIVVKSLGRKHLLFSSEISILAFTKLFI